MQTERVHTQLQMRKRRLGSALNHQSGCTQLQAKSPLLKPRATFDPFWYPDMSSITSMASSHLDLCERSFFNDPLAGIIWIVRIYAKTNNSTLMLREVVAALLILKPGAFALQQGCLVTLDQVMTLCIFKSQSKVCSLFTWWMSGY